MSLRLASKTCCRKCRRLFDYTQRFSRCCGLRPRWRWRLPQLRPRRAPATSERFRRKWAPIPLWALGFWAVVGSGCSLSASLTWGNVGVLRRFGSVRPAKPPRSCKWGLLGEGDRRRRACWLHRQLSDWRSRNAVAKLRHVDDGAGARCGALLPLSPL